MNHGEEDDQENAAQSSSSGSSSRSLRRIDGEHSSSPEDSETVGAVEQDGSFDDIDSATASVLAQYSEEHVGPLPHPVILQGYEELVPGSARDIINVYIDGARTRDRLLDKLGTTEARAVNLGAFTTTVLAVGGIAATVYLIIADVPVSAALAPLVISVLSGVAKLIDSIKGNRNKD